MSHVESLIDGVKMAEEHYKAELDEAKRLAVYWMDNAEAFHRRLNEAEAKLASAEKDRDEWKTTAMNMNEEKGRLLSRLDSAKKLLDEALDCVTMALPKDWFERADAAMLLPESQRVGERCPACNGNDADMPCAYPSKTVVGCMRDKRLKLERVVEKRPQFNPFYCEVCHALTHVAGSDAHACGNCAVERQEIK
jgi:hypothetical protein